MVQRRGEEARDHQLPHPASGEGGLSAKRSSVPTKDSECYSGKYKRVRFRGIVCERCGVEVTRSEVHHERMGHIELAAPVVHILDLAAREAGLAYLLMGTEAREELKAKQLKKVIYFAANLVTWVDDAKRRTRTSPTSRPSPGGDRRRREEAGSGDRSSLQDARGEAGRPGEVGPRRTPRSRPVSATSGRKSPAPASATRARSNWPSGPSTSSRACTPARSSRTRCSGGEATGIRYEDYFEGGMGGETISRLIDRIDLDVEEVRAAREDRRRRREHSCCLQRRQKAIERLKIVTAFNRRDENGRRVNDPRAMILDSVPVIPPDLRPIVQLDGGRFATSDLNDLYASHQPEQPAEAAVDLGAPRSSSTTRTGCSKRRWTPSSTTAAVAPGTGPGNRPLKSLSDMSRGSRDGPPEPAGQAGGLLGPLGHRDRPDPPAPPVRAAQADGSRASSPT